MIELRKAKEALRSQNIFGSVKEHFKKNLEILTEAKQFHFTNTERL